MCVSDLFSKPLLLFWGKKTLDGFAFDNIVIEGEVVEDPIEVISQFPYSESFEDGAGFWNAVALQGNVNDWELGTPAGSVIMGASDGENAWATNLDGAYADSQVSAVLSPYFDFSDLENPQFSLDIWYETEPFFDGAALQASVDSGASWITIGDQDDFYRGGVVFLNELGTSFTSGWTGNVTSGLGSGDYIRVTADLSSVVVFTTAGEPTDTISLAGESLVQFRVLFRAGAAFDGANELDGVAFDNILIEEATQPVVINEFPYMESFEEGNGGWESGVIFGSANSWELGTLPVQ
ncbi:MAG: hypothetical protein HC880_02190 [Bacteroidia bacterium]|nr:hypothetical protein [Bacteroidia bacterium]